MMNTEKLNKLIEKKAERQTILIDRKKQLEILRKELFSSKIGQFLGKMNYYVKRYVTFGLGILAFILAITLFVYPKVIYGEAEKQDLLMQYKADYYELVGKTIDDAVRGKENTGTTVSNAPNATTDLVMNINNSIQVTMENEILLRYKYMAFGLIILGFLFLYLSRMAKSIHARNLKITQVDTLIRNVIDDYGLTIHEEAEELNLFKEIVNSKITDVTPPETTDM